MVGQSPSLPRFPFVHSHVVPYRNISFLGAGLCMQSLSVALAHADPPVNLFSFALFFALCRNVAVFAPWPLCRNGLFGLALFSLRSKSATPLRAFEGKGTLEVTTFAGTVFM